MTVMASTLARRRGRIMLAFPVLTLLLCVLAVVHLGVGARTISPQTVVQALFHFDAKKFRPPDYCLLTSAAHDGGDAGRRGVRCCGGSVAGVDS